MTHVSLVWRSALANDLRVFECIRGAHSTPRVCVVKLGRHQCLSAAARGGNERITLAKAESL